MGFLDTLLGGGQSKEEERAQRFAAYSAGKAIEESQAMKARTQAGFEATLGVLGMLGQPGTYSSPVSGGPAMGPGGITSAYPTGGAGLLGTSASGGPGAGLNYQTGSIFTKQPISEEAWLAAKDAKGLRKALKAEGRDVLDPEAFTQMVSKMPVSQIISRQVAEAQGLTDPSSPFRQSLEQSIKNPILEAGAETLRESTRLIRNQMAKGGSARRAAFGDAQQMLAVERSNRLVSQQMWQANLQFESWIRDYQQNTVNAAMAFTNGLGVQQYTNAMNAAGQFMVEVALPTANQYKMQAAQIAMQNKKKGLFEMVLGGVGLIAGAFMGGGQGAGLGAQMGGMFGGMFGGGPNTGGGVNVPGTPGYAIPLSAGGYASMASPWER